MVNHIPITKASINLDALVKRAYLKGEYFILEIDGLPIAGLMSAGELGDYLELQDREVNKQIAKDFRKGRFRPVEEVLKELKNGGKKKPAARKHS